MRQPDCGISQIGGAWKQNAMKPLLSGARDGQFGIDVAEVNSRKDCPQKPSRK
jgi:hypothetical protein